MALLFLLILLLGIYLLTLGIWELREGENKKMYVTYTVSGLFLLFVFPRLFTSF
ncbi:DUF3953 domain-containing protein [Rossellomorea sp. AcN35-11]|nr:DUF3953 domain-containing protein [Rossellomorea aquimaris]NMH68347.1 DUF3953 domain-containing protein [Bacillus sp. RO3]WJV29779.1 DUF3953 domain-containing protein [Rossellomorea sp. AcN35-11]